MTAATSRYQRVLRVRAVEHRIAQQRLADAERRLNTLKQIADRIDTLRAQASAGTGVADGQVLKSLGEMAMRLENARADLATPMASALDHQISMDSKRGAAWAREESAIRLLQRSVEDELIARERRADANRPARRNVVSMTQTERGAQS
ncbi:MAG: hypothetical protein ABL928_01505 [Sphingorhabdus sp.]